MNALLNNPRAFVLLIALIIVAGLSALHALPRDEDPRIANRHAFATTVFPGASAERVEALITEPLENALREMPEVDHINSRSSAGFSSMTIELKDAVTMGQTDTVWAEVRDKLRQAEPLLPSGSNKPVLEERTGYPYTLIAALTWEFDDAEPDLLLLGRYAEELKSRLRGLPGTDYVAIQGEPEEEVVVDVNAAKAVLLGFSPHDIGLAVNKGDSKVTAGEIHNDRVRTAIEVDGALDTLDRIRQVPLRQNEDGSSVQIGDIAEVTRQAKTPAKDLAIVDGKPAVIVGIRMLADQRSDLWSASVEAALDEVQSELPANIKIKTIFDQEHYTTSRLAELTNNIVLGFVLISVVLLFALGWRAAVVVAAALPLTVLFAFACMNFIGMPIHQMSITGLIVSLGIMVDNAIVMVDTVDRFKRSGLSGLQATQKAVKHLWLPLLGSTLTTILTFMPILLMPGSAGEFVGGLGFTVLFSLVGSYLISHLVIAGLSGRFLARDNKEGWFYNGFRLKKWSPGFRQSIEWCLNRPKQVIALVAIFPLLGFVLGSTIPEQFFPPADRDMINLEVYLPVASSLDQTKALTEKLSQEINQVEGIKSLHWFIGRSAPLFYYNVMQGKDNSQYFAHAMLTTDHFSDVDHVVPYLQKHLDQQFPEAQILIRRLEQGPPFNAPVEVRLVGPDLEVLKQLGEQVRLQAMGLQDVVHVRTSLSEAVPKVWLTVDENLARAGKLGLTDISGQLHDAVDGAISASVLEDTQSMPVRVQAHGLRQTDLGRVHSWLLLPGETHEPTLPIPYAAIGDVDIRPAIGSIPRRDGKRINTVQVFIRDGVLPSVVLARVKQSLNENGVNLPPGFYLEYAGEDEQRDDAVGKLVGSLGLILVLLVVAVVISFNSFRLSVTIFIVAIQAAGLGILALFASGASFGFMPIIGLMGLIGLAINAAIVILAELKSNPAAVAGNISAIVTGVMHCSRHIVATTITTVMGFMPLILSGGEFWPPFAVVIASGTVLTTMVSFYFVPVAFLLMTRKRPFDVSEAEAAPA